MRLLVTTFLIVFASSMSILAQNQDPSETTNAKAGFRWLEQFEGTWQVESRTPEVSDDEEATHSAMMVAEAVGKHWMVCKQQGKVGGAEFRAFQTLGYDSKNDKYSGTWVDSASGHKWELGGSLEDGGKKLSLGSEGPDWQDASKMRKYRDVYEFKSANEISTVSQVLGDDGKWQTFMKGKMVKKESESMTTAAKPTVTPFLMFIGKAEEAIEFYKTVFPDVKVESMNKYKAGESGEEGTVQLARISIAGQKVMCIDSPAVHDFTFTPSFSFFVECEDLETLKERFAKLSDGGKVMMPVSNYGFSEQFGWASDKFGVSWQLSLSSDD